MEVTGEQRVPSRRLTLWLLASLPIIPFLLVFWAYALPAKSEGKVTHLVGPWQGHQAVLGFDPFKASDEGWVPLKLPGVLEREGLKGHHLWLKRTFVPPAETVGQDSLFIVGAVRWATLRIFLNGEPIGIKGDPSTLFIGTEANAFFVPGRLVREGENTLTMESVSLPTGLAAITDPRLIFGPYEVLGTWSFHEQQVRGVIEHGTLLLIACLGILVASLWVIQRPVKDAPLYRSTVLVVLASGAYLLGKRGFLISAVISGAGQAVLTQVSIQMMGLALVEFCETYYLRRTTWFGQLNRGITLTWSAVSLFLHQFVSYGAGSAVSRIFSLWMLLVITYTFGLAIRDLVKGTRLFGPLMAVATMIATGSGFSDLLSDLDLNYAPRLFTYAIANFAAMSSCVVVGEFLQVARENTRLSESLRLRAEELAQALGKAEQASRIKSEFLANTSHELRTPLNAIINIPQGLLEQFHDIRRARCSTCKALFALDEGEQIDPSSKCSECEKGSLSLESNLSMNLSADETARLLKSIIRSGNHLLSVVNGILDYSKLDAGRVVLYREHFRADVLLEELELAMQPVATQAGVNFVIESRVPGVSLDADRVKLGQVLINLVGNAIKFSDGKGTVTVRAALDEARQMLHISVSDKGIGIAEQNQTLIFEGFRQVEESSTRRFGGTGLGLAISKHLVELHEGTLSVESALGAGSTFHVELPLSPKSLEGPSTSSSPVIVVIDDEPSAIEATLAALLPLGYRIVGVQEPSEALGIVRVTRPVLIILDVMMPRISGLELLRELSKDPVLRQIPVLVSSAFPGNHGATEALGATFVAKPWKPGELLTVARNLLAKSASNALKEPV